MSNWSKEQLQKKQAAGRIRGYKFNNDGSLKKKKKKKQSKYWNTKVKIDGYEFDSKKEGNRYFELKEKMLAGTITDLELQKEFELHVNDEKVASYIADFVYNENGLPVVEDVKSKVTRRLPVYRLKKKLMMAIYKIEIKEV